MAPLDLTSHHSLSSHATLLRRCIILAPAHYYIIAPPLVAGRHISSAEATRFSFSPYIPRSIHDIQGAARHSPDTEAASRRDAGRAGGHIVESSGRPRLQASKCQHGVGRQRGVHVWRTREPSGGNRGRPPGPGSGIRRPLLHDVPVWVQERSLRPRVGHVNLEIRRESGALRGQLDRRRSSHDPRVSQKASPTKR